GAAALDVTNRPPPNKGSPRHGEPLPGNSPVAPLALAHIFEPLGQALDLDRDAIAADHDRALRHREIVGQDRDLVVLGGIELDDGAATEAKHLVDRHERGAEHHLDIERDLVERRHRIPWAIARLRPDHAMVSRWLTCAISWTFCPLLSLPRWSGAWTRA